MYRNFISYKTNIADKSHQHDVCHQTYVSSGVEFIHVSDKLYTSDVCNMACSDATAVSIHKQLHTGVKSFCCGICHKVCSWSSNLAARKRIQTGVKAYT